MKAVILAGGLGIRLKPFTEVIPKPLLPIGEKAVLEIQIEHLKKHGFDEIFLATNYKSSYIENFFGDGSKYGIALTISKEEKRLGTAGPLTLLKDKLHEPFLMMNGDILTLLDFSKMYNEALNFDTILTVGIKEIITPFQFGNIFHDDYYVTGIEEKPDIKTQILAGVYILRPEIFELIPENEHFGMDDLIKKMIKEKRKIAIYNIKEYWLDIGKLDDYNKAQEVYKTHFKD